MGYIVKNMSLSPLILSRPVSQCRRYYTLRGMIGKCSIPKATREICPTVLISTTLITPDNRDTIVSSQSMPGLISPNPLRFRFLSSISDGTCRVILLKQYSAFYNAGPRNRLSRVLNFSHCESTPSKWNLVLIRIRLFDPSTASFPFSLFFSLLNLWPSVENCATLSSLTILKKKESYRWISFPFWGKHF